MEHRSHLMVRATIAAPPLDPAAVKAWLVELIDAIGMKLAKANDLQGNPWAYYCDVPGNRGLTATALIETSNVTLHTWDERNPGELQLDLFTCGDLDVQKVMLALAPFNPYVAEYIVVDRRGALQITDSGIIAT